MQPASGQLLRQPLLSSSKQITQENTNCCTWLCWPFKSNSSKVYTELNLIKNEAINRSGLPSLNGTKVSKYDNEDKWCITCNNTNKKKLKFIITYKKNDLIISIDNLFPQQFSYPVKSRGLSAKTLSSIIKQVFCPQSV